MEIKIGLLGFGTVGVGVYELLQKNAAKITQLSGTTITVEKILVHNKEKHQAAIESGLPITDQFADILHEDSIQLVVEVMGSKDVAKDYLTRSLEAGKNVITANKDVLALHLEELTNLARNKKRDFLFEASVAGGIPVIRALTDSYVGDQITEVLGIVNGTTNFMLTRMDEEKESYEDALSLAQELGYAESDPSGDVEGYDAARKMVVLTKLAFGHTVDLADLEIRGISQLDSLDFSVAAEQGYTIKLVGRAKVKGANVVVEVAPMFVALSHPFTTVKNEFNGVCIIGEAVGETMFYGSGAGRMTTANSVVSDVVAIAKNIRTNHTGHLQLYTSHSYQTGNPLEEECDAVIRVRGTKMEIEAFVNSLSKKGEAAIVWTEETGLSYIKAVGVKPSDFSLPGSLEIEAVFKTIQ